MTTTDAPAAAPLTDEEVARWRRRFPILGRCTYLINNSLGAMPDTVPASLATYADLWATKGVEAWGSDWLPEVRRVADLLGSLIGAPAGSVVVHQNVATLTAMVAGTIDWSGERNRVVMTDVEWPNHHYLFREYSRQTPGAEVVVVPTDGVHVDTDRLLEAIDEHTAFVPVSHVLFRSAFINDVAAVIARAHDVGAVVMVDGYHATGHMPVDVLALDADFYVGGSVKWLCGGPGVGYLYIRPDHQGRLRDVGWLGHATPFAFATDWEAAEGAMGWLGGTPGMPSLYAAREGYQIIAEVGPARIRATSERLTARLVEGGLDRSLTIRTPVEADRRAGSVAFEATEQTSRRLIDSGIVVDYRPGAGIRVGAHFFNTVEECDRLLDALAASPG